MIGNTEDIHAGENRHFYELSRRAGTIGFVSVRMQIDQEYET
jgi:hypothetical protein